MAKIQILTCDLGENGMVEYEDKYVFVGLTTEWVNINGSIVPKTVAVFIDIHEVPAMNWTLLEVNGNFMKAVKSSMNSLEEPEPIQVDIAEEEAE